MKYITYKKGWLSFIWHKYIGKLMWSNAQDCQTKNKRMNKTDKLKFNILIYINMIKNVIFRLLCNNNIERAQQ